MVAAKQQQLRADGVADDHALLRQQQQAVSQNFYLKSKRSIDKPKNEGPAAYVLPGDEVAPAIRRVAAHAASAGRRDQQSDRAVHRSLKRKAGTAERSAKPGRESVASPTPPQRLKTERSRPAVTSSAWTNPTAVSPTRCSIPVLGAERSATDIYDDTAWTMGRTRERRSRSASWTRRCCRRRWSASPRNKIARRNCRERQHRLLVNHNADNALVTFRYRLKDVEMEAAEEPFDAAGSKLIVARS
jgi:hypothetical protein